MLIFCTFAAESLSAGSETRLRGVKASMRFYAAHSLGEAGGAR